MSTTVSATRALMIGSPITELIELASLLDADFVRVPTGPTVAAALDEVWPADSPLERWRDAIADGPARSAIVVAVWPDVHTDGSLIDMTAADFARRVEWPFAAWCAALGAASARCADGGTVVAVVERPAPLDCAGWSGEAGTADAVEALVRSLARSEGRRGVRVNVISTPTRLAPADPVAPAPSLATFPGRIDVEVRGAVAMLLSSDASGMTGSVLHADCGRSWR